MEPFIEIDTKENTKMGASFEESEVKVMNEDIQMVKREEEEKEMKSVLEGLK